MENRFRIKEVVSLVGGDQWNQFLNHQTHSIFTNFSSVWHKIILGELPVEIELHEQGIERLTI